MERRYLPRGTVAHALTSAVTTMAECGVDTWNYTEWHGTGSQREYENNAALPQCKKCVAKVGTRW